MSKNEKLFNKFKKDYSLILKDKFLIDLLKSHFDKNCVFGSFVIAFLENQIGKKRLMSQLRVNKDEWSELLCSLYKEEAIQTNFKKLEINPVVPLEQIIETFGCFNSFITRFYTFIKQHDLNLNINETDVKSLLRNVLGYLLYNNIECCIPYSLEKIIIDEDYDTKYVLILNNTKLFSLAKQSILKNCRDNINDLIVLLLGMSKQLNKEK